MPSDILSTQAVGREVVVETMLVRNYCVVAILTFFLCERISTAADEVQSIFRGPRTLIPLLYCSMNSLTLLYLLLYMAICWEPDCTSTYRLEIAATITSSILLLIYGAIAALRVYALSGLRYVLPCITLLLFFVGVGVNVYHCAFLASIQSQIHPCRAISNIPDLIIPRSTLPRMCTVKVSNKHALALELVLRLSNVLAEVIVVVVTWRHTFIYAQISNFRCWRAEAPLASMLLRDGSIYFGLLLSLNIAASAIWAKTSFQEVSLFFHTSSTVVLSRFLLNLRAAASRHSLNTSIPSSLVFPQTVHVFNDSVQYCTSDDEASTDGEAVDSDWGMIKNRPSISLGSIGVTPSLSRSPRSLPT